MKEEKHPVNNDAVLLLNKVVINIRMTSNGWPGVRLQRLRMELFMRPVNYQVHFVLYCIE